MRHDAIAAQVLRQDVQALQAYAVQPSAGFIKLDVMENPYRLPAHLQAELGQRLGAVALNRYPAERIEDLRAALAAHARLPEGCALMLGNGSDELISLLTLAVARPGATVLAPEPSFVMYRLACQLLGAQSGPRFVGLPCRAEDFALDVPALLEAIAKERPALLWLAYPNNPTGTLWDAGAIEQLIGAMQGHGLVVMDEAYQPFAERDSMDWLRRHPHVLLMRTLSKFGLAGVRIGYLMGRSEWVAQIEKLRPPFNVSVLNAEAALFALEHAQVFAEQAEAIRTERERLFGALQALPGVTPFPSQANMVLARFPDAAATFARLKGQGILVKNVGGMHPLLHNCLRLTVGTPAENTALIEALK
ncbi:histidinol-phosphate aminotransferase [Inhella inkyongensis]|uniref:Histidinol-phosphate aminotransferase n=1 Tax=Inhella inkyongensis TaxID=392593 RepID=A0A840S771_9BURK|nr:histidinol-phosphate transaminase [Inhella inkyongensis]MBB5204624.1 histidinol-phosphate aminotransferase [Inhella inkyongensis]